MKAVLLLSLFLASPIVMAQNIKTVTSCSDAAGYLRYTHVGGQLGDGATDNFELKIEDQIVSSSTAYAARAAELGPINPDFSDIQVLQEAPGHKQFTAKLVLSKNAASAEEPAIGLPLERYVICYEMTWDVSAR